MEPQEANRLAIIFEAMVEVWGHIGELSANTCHDLRMVCNTPPEAIEAIRAYRKAVGHD